MVYYWTYSRDNQYLMEIIKGKDGKFYVMNEERYPMTIQRTISQNKEEIRYAIETENLKGNQEEIAEIIEKLEKMK